jgi:hypothetical protein
MRMTQGFAKLAPGKLPAGEQYRDGASVGFSGATTEVIRAHPFGVLATPLRRI